MGRSILLCEALINDKPFIVSTVHLESLDNAKVRRDQLLESFRLLTCVNDSFIVGDFNFHSTWTAEHTTITESNFTDVYLDLSGDQEGFTMPRTPYFPEWRPDKILASKSSSWKASLISTFGMFSIPSFSG